MWSRLSVGSTARQHGTHSNCPQAVMDAHTRGIAQSSVRSTGEMWRDAGASTLLCQPPNPPAIGLSFIQVSLAIARGAVAGNHVERYMMGFMTMALWASLWWRSAFGPCDVPVNRSDACTTRQVGFGRAPLRGSDGQRRLLALRAAEIDGVRNLARCCGTRSGKRTLPYRIVQRYYYADGTAYVVIEPMTYKRGGELQAHHHFPRQAPTGGTAP